MHGEMLSKLREEELNLYFQDELTFYGDGFRDIVSFGEDMMNLKAKLFVNRLVLKWYLCMVNSVCNYN